MVDPERLLARLDRVGAELQRLRSQAERGREALRGDATQLDAAKYRLVVAIEACLDGAQHVVASEGLRRPSGLADTFVVLGEAGLLTPPTVAAARRMAGFRNVLVHGYAHVNDDLVVDAVLTRLDEVEQLRSELAALAR